MEDVKMINLKINGQAVSVPEGTTVLDAAKKAGIRIPTLCYLRDINAIGACRVCVVEVKGARSLVASCVYPVSEGMEPIEGKVRPQHLPGCQPVSDKPHEHLLAVTQVRVNLPQDFVLPRKPCQRLTQAWEITRQHAFRHPLPEGTVLGIRHGLAHKVVDFGIGLDIHVKPVAPAALYIAYAAVPVFVNAVNPYGDSVFNIE